MDAESPDEIVVYYTITIAARVSLAEGHVSRIAELRDEMHVRDDDPPVRITDQGPQTCEESAAAAARSIADSSVWPAHWEFGH